MVEPTPAKVLALETAGVKSRRPDKKSSEGKRCLSQRYCERYKIDDRTCG
jgi:hypothetical protein